MRWFFLPVARFNPAIMMTSELGKPPAIITVEQQRMNEATNLIATIAKHVRTNGVITNRAKSAYGADIYELQGVKAMLVDEGYTRVIRAEGLDVYQTASHDPKFVKGNLAALQSVSDLLLKQTPSQSVDNVEITVTEFGGTERQHPTKAVLTIDQKTACQIMDALQMVIGSEVIDSISLKAPIPRLFDEDLPYFHEMLNAKYVVDCKGNVWVSVSFKEFMDEIDAMLPLDTIKELFDSAPSHMLSAKQLEAVYGSDGDNLSYHAYHAYHAHHAHPECNWRREAEKMKTVLGYWDWVAEQLQLKKGK